MTKQTAETATSTISRRVRALLAGGLVLGVGAAVVLAAWNDSEFAQSTFTAGALKIEGSTTSSSAGFGEHDTAATAAALAFTAPFTNLSPGAIVYAPFWVRLNAGTTEDATFELSSIASANTGTGAANDVNLSYEIYELASLTDACDATNIVGLTPIASGLDVVSGSAITASPVSLTMGTSPAAGTPVNLCFVVTAGTSLQPSGITTTTWQFTATSTT